MYALREALRLVAEEGLENTWDRHHRVASALKAGVDALGTPTYPEDDCWLPTLNAVTVPDGVDEDRVIDRLMEEHGIEIVGGLGALDGEIFRVGCMGNSARPENILNFLAAFGTILDEEGAMVDVEAGVGNATAELR